jgi:Activator of Hsp90 ATPase homolog 1-like protein
MMVAPVRKQLRVRASQARAFAVFTDEMSSWWPATHSILKSPQKACIVEPRVGGRWYAVGEDGSTCLTGYVIAWNPPQSLLLAWQINAQWQYDPALITEVDVRFIAESESVTRIELEHRYLERMGAQAAQARSSVDSPGGWGAIIESFKKHTEKSD